MQITRTRQPDSEPIDITQAKLHLRVDGNTENAYIESLITAAREDCENRLQRTLVNSTWTLRLDAFPDVITLPQGPVKSVTSISYIDTEGVTQTLTGSLLVGDNIYPAYNTEWPATRAQPGAVTVVYVAGYGTEDEVPMPLRQWMLLAIGDMYASRERSSDKPVVSQGFADRLLDPYKVWGF